MWGIGALSINDRNILMLRGPDTALMPNWLYLPVDYIQNNGRNPQGGRWPMVVTWLNAWVK